MQNIGLPGNLLTVCGAKPSTRSPLVKKSPFQFLRGAVGLLMSQLLLYPTLTKKLGLLATRRRAHPSLSREWREERSQRDE